jgi:hypothetical protein
VQILLLAQALGYLQLGNISLDGSKIHADASKSKAVSYKRLLAIEAYLRQQVAELIALAAAADKAAIPEKMCGCLVSCKIPLSTFTLRPVHRQDRTIVTSIIDIKA